MEELGTLGVSGFVGTQSKLTEYLKSERIHHSILLVGPNKSQRIQIATRLAETVLCQAKNLDPKDPNNSIVRRVRKGIHPDVFIYQEPEESTIKIEVIRQLCQQMELSAVEGGAKVCIIDQVERLSPGAENALLKSLEEPSTGRYFLLLTEQPASLLPTVLSRCIQFTMEPDKSIEENLQSEEAIFLKPLEEFMVGKNTLALKEIVKDREISQRFVNYLQLQLRQSISNPAPSNPFKGSPVTRALEQFDACTEAESQLRSNANYGLIIENLMIQQFAQENPN